MKEEFDFYDKNVLKSYNLSETMRYQLNMLDSLDVFTRKHCENVANLTCRLCDYLRLNKNFTIYCTTCAYLHDIGKIFIPSYILQKKAKLTDEEYEIMKTHTTLGYNMCMNDHNLQPYAAGPIYHHEGLDGSGYPKGLTIDDIPLEGQIIRVADEYDAIVSKRQYKTHVDISDTLQFLIDECKPTGDNKYGKLNRRIVKKLLKVVIDDIEYEIFCVDSYVTFLDEQIKRLENVDKLVNDMKKAKSDKDKKDYMVYIDSLLSNKEDINNYSTILDEYRIAYGIRKKRISKLYDEIKKIKKMKV